MCVEGRGDLFVGIRITANLKRHLDERGSRYEYLLEGTDEQSLRRATIDGQEILGRLMEQGSTVDSLANVVRNLKSILLKICPEYVLRDSEIRIYARTGVRSDS